MRSRAVVGPSTPTAMHPRADLRALLARLGAMGVPPTPRAVAVALWTHADPCGRCWPSQVTLARLTGRCERTVRDAVKILERVGVLLRDVPDLRERRRCRRTTAYRFTVGSWRSPSVMPSTAAPPSAHPVEVPHGLTSATAAPAAPAAPPVEVSPAACAVEAEGAPVERVDPVTPVEAPAPLVGFAGWTLVDLDGEDTGIAPPSSPATAAPASPATVAARRLPRAKAPPTPAAPRRPPLARCAPLDAPRPWSTPALADAAVRLRGAVGRRGVG